MTPCASVPPKKWKRPGLKSRSSGPQLTHYSHRQKIKNGARDSAHPVNDLGASRLAVDGDRNGLETMGASSPGLFTAVSERGIKNSNDRFTGVFSATICCK